MVKYSTEFKLHVVKEYLEGSLGLVLLAEKYGIPSNHLIHKWVTYYQSFGKAGLERKQTETYTGDFKLNVLNYMEHNKASLTETAIHFGISSPSTISIWKKKFTEGGVEALFKSKRRPREDMAARQTPSHKKSEEKELTKLEQLEAENLRLRIENEYLKKLKEYGLPPRNRATKSKP